MEKKTGMEFVKLSCYQMPLESESVVGFGKLGPACLFCSDIFENCTWDYWRMALFFGSRNCDSFYSDIMECY